ncbi:MAG: CHAT domain-containing tetratricopeptide repeat protein [Bacteroidia bacterium]|nr:CHAT domain-containing tetratricopeptide repeat protein [Bacteroidia bacterium]
MRWLIILPILGWSQPATIRADSLREAGEYKAALALYDSVISRFVSTDSSRLQAYLGGIECLLNLSKYEKAYEWISQAERLAKHLRDTLRWMKVYYYQAWMWDEEGKYRAAESLYTQVAKWQREHLGEKHYDYLLTLNDLGIVYEHLNRYGKAESLYNKVLALQAEILGRQHPDYQITLSNLTRLYEQQGQYQIAESLYNELAKVEAQTLGEHHPEYLTILHSLALIYHRQARYAQAESLYQKVAQMRAKILGPQHKDYITTLNNLAVVYEDQGKYAEAETLYRRVVEVRAQILGTHHPEYLAALHNLAGIYERQGYYAEAEALYQKVADLKASIIGPQHISYLNTQSCLARVYERQGRYAEAEKIYQQVAEAQAHLLGHKAEAYLTTLYNMAVVYARHGKFSMAESLYRKVAEIQSRAAGTQHPIYLTAIAGMADILEGQGRYVEAEKLYTEVAETQSKILGSYHPDYFITLQRMAFLYYRQGRFAEAESLYHRVAEGLFKTLGPRHPYYVSVIYRVADLWGRIGRYALADSLWQVVVEKTFQYLQREMGGLPTVHQERFLEANVMGRVRAFHRYVAQRGASNPDLLRLGYRVARSTKGLILTTSEGLRYLAEASSDSTTRQLFIQWRTLITQSAMFAMQDKRAEADSIWEVAVEIEQKLIRLLPEIRTFLPNPFTEPDPKLGRDEALVEVVRVKHRDSLLYLFYLLLPNRRQSQLLLHVHRVDSVWEVQAQNVFEILRSPSAQVTGLAYRILWSFIDSLLPRGVKKVFFSPDGIYYRINIGALYDGKNFIADRYEVRYIASSRRLVVERRRLAAQKPVVIGNPAFDQTSSQGTGVRSYRLFEGGIPPLPGAEAEVKEVAKLLGVSPLIGDSATEEQVKHLKSPQILHIATHGYFREGTGSALLRSGLLLAGAAVWDSLYPPLGVDDGHLTAREVSGINLLGTDLVVLSACETGLGDITGEGLYGLQRAFLEAGAQRVIATLWQIDDAATRELMQLFYERMVTLEKRKPRLLNSRVSENTLSDRAFAEALGVFRRKYREPYYWGAFIIMR